MVVYFVTFQVIYVKDFPLYSENISAIFFLKCFVDPPKFLGDHKMDRDSQFEYHAT